MHNAEESVDVREQTPEDSSLFMKSTLIKLLFCRTVLSPAAAFALEKEKMRKVQ
jgi:hypothetical protein